MPSRRIDCFRRIPSRSWECYDDGGRYQLKTIVWGKIMFIVYGSKLQKQGKYAFTSNRY
jgi:hypothetical protein